MRKLLVSIVAFLAISCNGGIHETIYRVEFIDGKTVSVVGYDVNVFESYYVVKSVNNNSVFDKEQVRGIYPEEVGVIWNPIKNEKYERKH